MARIATNSESTKSKSKIPDYAKDFRKEWLFIRGINKDFEKFVKKYFKDGCEIFVSGSCYRLMSIIRRFLKAQELGYLKDISSFRIKVFDVDNLLISFPKLKYDEFVNGYPNSYPGYREFYECFSKFHNKLNIEFPEKNKNESDSESEIDIDDILSDFNDLILTDSDSDSD